MLCSYIVSCTEHPKNFMRMAQTLLQSYGCDSDTDTDTTMEGSGK